MCDHCGCREFGRLAELTADHRRILELAWSVSEAFRPDDAAWRTARDELAALLDVHVMKEETGLYPLLIATGDLDPEQRDGLEEQHRVLFGVVGRGEFDRREYYALAAHIDEEEYELFPAAMYAFDDDEWDKMDSAHHAAFHHFGVEHTHGPTDHPVEATAPDTN